MQMSSGARLSQEERQLGNSMTLMSGAPQSSLLSELLFHISQKQLSC